MRQAQLRHLAQVLAQIRRRLEATAADPADPDREDVLERAVARIIDVEATLLEDAARPSQKLRERARHWFKPRLTFLRHHAPERLMVPNRYLRTTPPDPAPRISIVTPSFQQEAFLARTIYSVVSQHYPKLEYVVQDGGSSDGTVEILKRFERDLTTWESAPDAGQAAAVNRGMAKTTGEIMAYLNSDDLLLPGSLAFVARYFVHHPTVDVVYGHRLMLDEHDAKVGSWVLPGHHDATLSVLDYVPQETLFWRRRAWEAAGGHLDESLQFAMDWDLLLRLRDSGARMVRLRRYLGAFRVHGEQKTHTARDAFHREAAMLLRRANGRGMTEDEAFARARPYLRRHIAHHTLHRALDRLPLPRVEVRTAPPA